MDPRKSVAARVDTVWALLLLAELGFEKWLTFTTEFVSFGPEIEEAAPELAGPCRWLLPFTMLWECAGTY